MAIPVTLKPTIKQFIDAVGEQEVSELTTLDNPLATGYITDKVQAAIDRAWCFIESYEIRTGNVCSKYAIRRNAKNLAIDIARYYLDALRPSETVIKRYEESELFLKESVENRDTYCNLSTDELTEVGLEEVDTNRKILCDSNDRVFTRQKSLNGWRTAATWRRKFY